MHIWVQSSGFLGGLAKIEGEFTGRSSCSPGEVDEERIVLLQSFNDLAQSGNTNLKIKFYMSRGAHELIY